MVVEDEMRWMGWDGMDGMGQAKHSTPVGYASIPCRRPQASRRRGPGSGDGACMGRRRPEACERAGSAPVL